MILHEIGDLDNYSLALSSMGELAVARGNSPRDWYYTQQGVELAVKAGNEWAVLIGWINLCGAVLGLGDPSAAVLYQVQTIL